MRYRKVEKFFNAATRKGQPIGFYYPGPIWADLTDEERQRLTNIRHTWKVGDRFYKLAEQHYGDPTSWWVIAMYNGMPTEGHVRTGTTILIPTPVGRLLTYWGF
jgi:nucleoid-associated protein YgaU